MKRITTQNTNKTVRMKILMGNTIAEMIKKGREVGAMKRGDHCQSMSHSRSKETPHRVQGLP
eukprot:CAMPEP_0181331242 /NCGR_PEP_ID=MMETSP1101-20121128/24388_1 /TAXON_ID=46948 /ORGANISM="Rhodomonas abbreviata, Strain Caron Lab Isolate" /LENGTH=61 /DNA_ID=CAMNT_0023440671 /DNA_START=184 /DNA_END=366 /DNA_ORIENTATION=-